MDIEMNLIMSILKLMKSGLILKELVKKDAKIPSSVAEKLFRKLQNDELIYVHKDVVEVESEQRLKLAVRAVSLGADVENVSGFLQWQEFEKMAAVAFERNGYNVYKNLRFSHGGRRWEIDIVGCKKPIAVCVDCKHWHHGLYPSQLRRIVVEQVERTSALADARLSAVDKIECVSWNSMKLVPAVLVLSPGRFRFYDDVPIIGILQLQDFISQLPAYIDSVKHFSKP